VYRRGQHAKETGCARAEFIVEPNLPDNFQYGVFREARTYEAIVRFSNGSGQLRSDKVPDGRGMSIKLLDVGGAKVISSEELQRQGAEQQQDFIMVANPTFAFSDVKDYMMFFEQRKSVGDEAARIAFATADPRKGKIIIDTVSVPIENPLDIQYWSMSPYSLGTQAMKFSAKSLKEAKTHPSDHEHYLFIALEETLKQADSYFDFLIQIQTDPQKTPIEDVSIEWRSQDAPFVKVATVKIPKQEIEPEFRQQCELLTWNPWHALVEHKPLGGINRLRRAVYWDSAQRRLS
jgi:hypothetical protein